MTDHQITYRRDTDRTRIIFSYPAEHTTLEQALQRAADMAPIGFRHAATKPNHDGQMHVPMDGDDYGYEPPLDLDRHWTREFAKTLERHAA